MRQIFAPLTLIVTLFFLMDCAGQVTPSEKLKTQKDIETEVLESPAYNIPDSLRSHLVEY